MGKKKKQFIDKKTAHHFYVLHRSQQDPLYYKDAAEGGSKYILHPANERTAEALEAIGALDNSDNIQNYSKLRTPEESSSELREIDEYGLPIDGYDYHQHLAPISHTGTFIARDGKPLQAKTIIQNEASTKLKLPAEALATVEEQQYDRMLEAITLKPDSMDEDVRALLELDDDEANGFDNDIADENKQNHETLLDDDFMQQLISKGKEHRKEDKMNQVFDDDKFEYEKHIARLMAQVEAEIEERDNTRDILAVAGETDSETNRELREIDEHFDALLEAEYNDYEIGDLDDTQVDEKVAGEIDATAERVQNIIEEHLQQLKLEAGKENKIGEGELKSEAEPISAFENTQDELSDNESITEILSCSGYGPKPLARWDCGTITTTYSTLDNHPSIISTPKRHSQKEKSTTAETTEAKQNLSSYTESHVRDISISRPRIETPEEKRIRKRLVKEQKRLRRQQKKEMALVFKDEKVRQSKYSQKLKAAACPPEGVSTFKL